MPKHLSIYNQSMEPAMAALAKQVLIKYSNPDKSSYFDKLFRLQLAAGQYTAAIRSIDSVRKYAGGRFPGTAAAVGIQFRCYAMVRQNTQEEERGFAAAYLRTLTDLYQQLPEPAKAAASSYFEGDTATIKSDLEKVLRSLAPKEVISQEEAINLIRKYNVWHIYPQIQQPGLDFFRAEDDKKYIIQDSLTIRMKDGAQLSAVVVRLKTAKAPLPVILRYNIYAGRSDISWAKKAANSGYVGVVINTRGKYLSPEAIEPFEHDAADAYEALDWISKQPWCNEKIGMYGGSYLGFSQWSAVKKIHPALKTIVPQVAVGIGIDYPCNNGVFQSYMLHWIHFVTNNKLRDDAEFSDEAYWSSMEERWFRSGKSFRSMDSLEGRPSLVFQRWLQHPSFDSYWQSMVPYGAEFANVNIPILTTTGYYDADQLGAFYYLMEHLKWNKNANHYLLIGPYDHAGGQSVAAESVEGYKIDSVANIDVNATVFQWFDHILKDGPMPSLLKDKINYEVMDANEWRSAPTLDSLSNDSLRLYLDNRKYGKKYELVPERPKAIASIDQAINFTAGRSGHGSNGKRPGKIVDHNLVFMSDRLDQETIMTGSMHGEIRITINKKDVDLNAVLYEQRKNGKYFRLSNWLVRASYVRDRTQRQLLQAGKEEALPVNNSFFTSKKIAKGSRIVLIIGVNHTKDYQVNYGTGKDVSDETIEDGKEPLHIRWSNQSYITLPLSSGK